MGRNGKRRSRIGDRRQGVCHRAHGAALHAAVVIGCGHDRIASRMPGVRCVIAMSMIRNIRMLIRRVRGVADGGRGGSCEIESCALPPRS